MLSEVLDEYLLTYKKLSERIETFDRRALRGKSWKAELFFESENAQSLKVETGDFHRFSKAKQYAAFLELVSSEHSSGEKEHRGRITKAGNTHLMRLVVESAQSYERGKIGYKSKALKSRQNATQGKLFTMPTARMRAFAASFTK